MWYSGQSYPVIYQATRGLGLVKRLRCSSVFKQRYSFKGGRDKWEIRPVFSGNNGWATSNLFQENLLSYGHYEPDHWPLSKFEVKIEYGNSGYYSLVAWMLRIYHVFLEFTDQMENRAKDGIWELSALLSLAG